MVLTFVAATLTAGSLILAGRSSWGPLWHLPATLVHEAMHWVVAQLCSAKPSFPSVIPRRQLDGSWQLGSVTFTEGRWATGAVALAPLLLLPAALALLTAPTAVSDGILAGIFVVAAIPSPQDWYLAIKAPLGALVVLGVVGGCVARYAQPFSM